MSKYLNASEVIANGRRSILVEKFEDYVRLEFHGTETPALGTGLHVSWVVDGQSCGGTGEPIDGANPLVVVVYRASRIDRTSIKANYAFQFEGAGAQVIAVKWSSSHAVGIKIFFDIVDGFQAEDLGDSSQVRAYLRKIEKNRSEANQITEELMPPFIHLKVNGYRGFADEAILKLAIPNGSPGSGLTIIVGANNSGKSTFLEAMHIIARARRQSEQSIPQPRRNRSKDYVSIELERADGRGLRVASVRPGTSQAISEWLPPDAGPTSFAIHVTPSRRSFNPYFSSRGSVDRDWGLIDQEFSRTQTRDTFVERLRKVDLDVEAREKFDRLLEEIVGYHLEWTFDEIASGQQFVKLIEVGGLWHTSEGLGEGLISLLFIVDALYDAEPGSLIAIDEPELSLHPQLIRRLRKVLSRFAARHQIVISTHSPLLVEWEDIAAGATIARIHKVDGQSCLSQPSSETLKEIAAAANSGNLNNPHMLDSVAREAFFLEDGILLLEGQEDVVYLPRVLRSLGLEEIENIYGWGVGGVTRMALLARLFRELGFSKIAALADGDGQPDTDHEMEKLAEMAPEVLARQIPAKDIRTKRNQGPREGKPGLLDDRNEYVRPELAEETRSVIVELQRHIS